jgi:peptidoglycan/LPS O-acetylase OafA/YrhL
MAGLPESGRTLRAQLQRTDRLSNAFVGRANAFGLLRLVFAVGVLVTHSDAIGYYKDLSPYVNLGHLGVTGFFAISGFLITRSALRIPLPRYLWHRSLRIMPGLWVCLLVSGFLIAPVFWWRAHHTMAGLFGGPNGVYAYLLANWRTGSTLYGIQDVFIDTPYGHAIGASVLNGSLWTLAYEMVCYVGIGILLVTAVLRRARWLVLAGTAFVGALLFADHDLGHPYVWHINLVWYTVLPYFGLLLNSELLWLGATFLTGAVAALFARFIPINNVIGVLALAGLMALQTTGHWLSGAYIPLYVYVILWAAVRLPASLHWVGQRNDYSYGVYIYAFPVQQSLAELGVNRIGLLGYTLVSMIVTFALAVASWHLVEKRALQLKDWTPPLLGWLGAVVRRRVGPADRGAPVPHPRHAALEAGPAVRRASVPHPRHAAPEPGPVTAVHTSDS